MDADAHDEAARIIAELTHDLKVLKETTVGWTKVDLIRGYRNRYHSIDVEMWCDENCGDFKKFGSTFYFREEKDASMFIMRWL